MTKFSKYAENIKSNWWKDYGVTNLLENDLDALSSRIYYVQNREASSWNVFQS